MRLYRYLSRSYAISSLESKQLRIGRLHELNDPFDCFPCIQNIPISGEGVDFGFARGMLETWTKHFGVICFSAKVDDPVLWSHYAEAHYGIVLAFDLPDHPYLHSVTYSDQRPQLDFEKDFNAKSPDEAINCMEGIMTKAFTVKATSWSYEQEYRQFLLFDNCMPANGMYFTDSIAAHLSQIILGARCDYDVEYFKRSLLRIDSKGVEVVKARQSYDSYKIQV